MGQLRWWRRGKRAVTQTSWWALPQKSAVDEGYRFDEVNNTVPGNRNTAEHVNYIFDHVVEKLVNPTAKIQIIGVSEGAFQVSQFLDNQDNWKKWSGRIHAYAAIATYFQSNDFTNKEFAEWYKKVALPPNSPSLIMSYLCLPS